LINLSYIYWFILYFKE